MPHPLQFPVPQVDPQWADSRKTDMVVATAIHAMAGPGRTPEDIWEDPTPAEWDQVLLAVENYVLAERFSAQGQYNWGEEAFTLPVE